MKHQLFQYLPQASHFFIEQLLDNDKLVVKIKSERKTKHGDYRALPNGHYQITVNANLNPYQFLITLVHEIAHFEAYKNHGKHIKPHGKAWKMTFQRLMLPFLNPKVFPQHILPILANHFKNPKASSNTDIKLAMALKQYNKPNNKINVIDVAEGEVFIWNNGKQFKRGKQRRKRIECIELASGRLYLFNPIAEVELVNTEKTKDY